MFKMGKSINRKGLRESGGWESDIEYRVSFWEENQKMF
jgi:hypothetical protein